MNIIVNKAINVWGAYSYKQNLDVVRVKVPLKEEGDSLEAFSMIFDREESGMILHMGWGIIKHLSPLRNNDLLD